MLRDLILYQQVDGYKSYEYYLVVLIGSMLIQLLYI